LVVIVVMVDIVDIVDIVVLVILVILVIIVIFVILVILVTLVIAVVALFGVSVAGGGGYIEGFLLLNMAASASPFFSASGVNIYCIGVVFCHFHN
jgi:uncharacterized membrane protein